MRVRADRGLPDHEPAPQTSDPASALRRLTTLVLAGAVALALISGCASKEDRRPPTGGRTVLMSEGDGEESNAGESTGEAAAERPRRPPRLSTAHDDQRVGEQAAKEVEAEMGLYRDEALNAYLDQVGQRVARNAPSTFRYSFSIVDQSSPNAFALPGGFIFVSRGLLALSNDEDELANVIGHEITHSANRHAAAQQERMRRQSPFLMPYVRYAQMAAYSRDLERDADRGGQKLAARAGYDPFGMTRFMQALDSVTRLQIGYSRLAAWYDTHPGSTERASDTATRASQLAWRRNERIAPTPNAYVERIDGIILGPDPAEGVFRGQRFLHPDLDFHLRFPRGWTLVNTHRAVGATSPDGRARIFLVAGKGEDPKLAAEALIAKHVDEFRIRVQDARPIRIGDIDAYRVDATAEVDRVQVRGRLTFIPYGGIMYRLVGVAQSHSSDQVLSLAHSTARTFRPLTPDERASIHVLRVRSVEARPGESLVELSKRSGNAWDPTRTGVLNQVPASQRYKGGELVKIVREERYKGGRPEALQGG